MAGEKYEPITVFVRLTHDKDPTKRRMSFKTHPALEPDYVFGMGFHFDGNQAAREVALSELLEAERAVVAALHYHGFTATFE